MARTVLRPAGERSVRSHGGTFRGERTVRTPRRDPRRPASALAAAWLLPVLLHPVRLDVLLTGAVLSFGLLFPLRPRGLAPVPEAQYRESTDQLRTTVSRPGAAPTLLVADKNVADRVRADLSAHRLSATVLDPSLG